ncbi:MAG: DUF3099 domain-containing protein [Nocardioidaceae bacterium]|nr:DUF3099 domain-containing protein [Nocardioidaceae bacterium]
MPGRERRRSEEPIRITTAPPSRHEDTAARQRHYLISMAVRTGCVIGAVVVGHGLLLWIFLAGAVVLPYVSVVVANTSSHGADAIDLPDAPSDLRHLTGTD